MTTARDRAYEDFIANVPQVVADEYAPYYNDPVAYLHPYTVWCACWAQLQPSRSASLPGIPRDAVPTCPKCGSENGILGTSYAYFVCVDCALDFGRGEWYWTPDNNHPHATEHTWQEACDMSPWGRYHPTYKYL